MENEVVNNGGNGTTTPVEQGVADNPQGNNTPEVQEQTFTKSQVIDLMKKRVERSHNSFFKRYGVENLQAMDELFEKAKNFQSMQDEYGAIQLKNDELVRENAFLRNNINPEKYDDIIAFFRGTNTPFTEEALLQALANHSEWLKQNNIPTTTIRSLGAEAHIQPSLNESEKAGKLLGVKF